MDLRRQPFEPHAVGARLPTLTEVVEVALPPLPASAAPAPAEPAAPELPPAPPAPPPIDAAALGTQLLDALLPRIDAFVEARLRESLARLTTVVVADARTALAAELRSAVADAVAGALTEPEPNGGEGRGGDGRADEPRAGDFGDDAADGKR
ncbi:hypothetical protein [Azohydromonas sp.]|uniref:hypothetical protein n=1 Tax=Azohydromonas sp. TaxID=1872666 RepID=UPI002BBA5C20|nr:hypothetical protein [Azohydromonas sp.]HMM86734.1 hypothetical protein [Azohydromonas sp.]